MKKYTMLLLALLGGVAVGVGVKALSTSKKSDDDSGSTKSAGDVVGGWVDWAVSRWSSSKKGK